MARRQLHPGFQLRDWFGLPTSKRLVIELVTALIEVPPGESARLRMFTGIGQSAGNFDLSVLYQGLSGGQAVWTATHSIRAYADSLLAFNINRDNANTPGHALICVSGIWWIYKSEAGRMETGALHSATLGR